MKTFLRPSPLKIILAFVLFFAASYLWRMYIISTISDTFPLGFPLQFYLAWGPCPPGESCSEFNRLWLILDFVIWYVVSAFIMRMIKKEATLVERRQQNESSTK
jgi:hypothetical protein